MLARGEGAFFYYPPFPHQHLALFCLQCTVVQISKSELVMIHYGDEVEHHFKTMTTLLICSLILANFTGKLKIEKRMTCQAENIST